MRYVVVFSGSNFPWGFRWEYYVFKETSPNNRQIIYVYMISILFLWEYMAQDLLGTWAGPGTRAQGRLLAPGPAAGPGPLGPGTGPSPCAKEPLGHVFSQEKYGNHINIYYLAISWRCLYLQTCLNMFVISFLQLNYFIIYINWSI